MLLVVPSRMMKGRNQNMSPAFGSPQMFTWGLVRRSKVLVQSFRRCSGRRSASLAGFCRPGNSAILELWRACIGRKAELWKRVFTTSRGHVRTAPAVPATLKKRKWWEIVRVTLNTKDCVNNLNYFQTSSWPSKKQLTRLLCILVALAILYPQKLSQNRKLTKMCKQN